MSERTSRMRAEQRRRRRPRLPAAASDVHRRGPMANIAAPTEKAVHFRSSLRRLVAQLRPDRLGLVLVVGLCAASVTLTVIGPRLLGHATDIIFRGVIGGQLPTGATAEEATAELRASGEDRLADMVSGMDVVPGRGIQFDDLRNVLLLALALYVIAALLAMLQGRLLNRIVNRAVRQLRGDVESKLHRLPLSYFDRQPRGEILSRATNDIDNIQQSVQQTLSQLLTSTFTVIGVVVMMVSISPLLALIALVTIPLVVLVTRQIAKRSKRKFIAQWSHTGRLNGQIEEAFSGHSLVKVFGRRARGAGRLRRRERGAVPGGLRRPVHLRADHAGDDVHREPQLRRHRRRRRAAGGVRGDDARRRAGVRAVLAAVHPAADPGRLDDERAAVRASPRRSGSSSCSMPPRSVPTPRTPATIDGVRGHVEFDDVSFRYVADRPLIEHLSLDVAAGPDRRHRRSDRCRQDDDGQPDHALLRPRRRDDPSRRRRHLDDAAARRAWRDRDGPPGCLAVRRDDPRQHRLRRVTARRTSRSSRRPGSATSTASSTHFPTATTPSSTTRAAISAPASGSW